MTTRSANKFAFIAIALLALFHLTGISFATAAEFGTFEVSASGMIATAQFTRSTPCAPFELLWGDGEEDKRESIEEICIQILAPTTLRHEYEAPGTYDLKLTLGDKTYNKKVTVPAEGLEFTLADVASVTSKWVDPYEMMADEEYYIYTITLNSGNEVIVEVAGFTTEEWRHEKFEEAGYSGDVETLIRLARPQGPENVVGDHSSDPAYEGRLRELIDALSLLRERLQALLTLRRQ